jgi:hypothetical protein
MLRLLALLCLAGAGLRLAGAGLAGWAAAVALLTAAVLGGFGRWLGRLHRLRAD